MKKTIGLFILLSSIAVVSWGQIEGGGSSAATALGATPSCAAGSVNIDGGTLYIDCATDDVGFGTTAPEYPLHVVGQARVTSKLYIDDDVRRVTADAASGPGFTSEVDQTSGMFMPVAQHIGFSAGGTERMYVSSEGARVVGTFAQNTVGLCTLGLTTTATGAITGCVASSQILKQDILQLVYDPTVIDRLHPVTYVFKENPQTLRQGFLSEEVGRVVPRAQVPAGQPGITGVDPNSINAALVIELQHLRRRVAVLEKKK